MSVTMEKILLVDDEPHVLSAYQRQFRKRYQIRTAHGGEEALDLLEAHGPFAVVISDCRMPGMDGIQLLGRVRDIAPQTVRMMLTGNADLDTAMDAVNQGEIFRFLTKPCPPESFEKAIAAGIEQYRLIRAEKELLEQTLTGSLKALADVLALVNPEAFGRASRLKRYVKGLAEYLGLPDIWRLEIAASLSQIGCVVLSESLVQKINTGIPLTSEETQAFYQHTCTGADILANIPRMQEIAEIIAYQHKHFDGTGTPHDETRGEAIPLGARLLKVAFDFDTLRMQNLPRSEAYERLETQKHWYDPAVLHALKVVFVPEQKFKLVSVSLHEITARMVLADNIYDQKGNLLVAKGQDLTDWIVSRLKQIAHDRAIKEPIRVILPYEPDGDAVHDLAAVASDAGDRTTLGRSTSN